MYVKPHLNQQFCFCFFQQLSTLLSSFNEILSIIGNLFDTFIKVPLNFDDIFNSIISLIKTVVFVIFGIMAFKQEDIRIPPIDDAIDKK